MGSTKKGTDASRAERKAKKRKLEDAVPDLPGDDNENNDIGDEEGQLKRLKTKETDVEEELKIEKKKKQKKEKKNKALDAEEVDEGSLAQKLILPKDEKEKQSKSSSDKQNDATDVLADLMELDNAAPKKSKKERKADRKAKEAADQAAAATTTEQPPPCTEPDEVAKGPEDGGEQKKTNNNNNRNRDKKRKEKALQKAGEGTGKDARFIVFIGNLPFSATTASITKHFASVQPKSVRHLTQKDDPSKSRGIAFVEFDGYDHMKTCLKLFHHSMFDDGISPARKINVELTAGGGGNTKDRKAKIQEKNAKLNDQRTRRIQEEEKAKLAKKEGADDERGGSSVHPSRRGRVPGAS